MFKNIINKFIMWAARDDAPVNASMMCRPRHDTHVSTVGDGVFGINFTVYSAVGGKIVKINDYDQLTDKHLSTLYIVHDTDDLGEEISMIITRQLLTR